MKHQPSPSGSQADQQLAVGAKLHAIKDPILTVHNFSELKQLGFYDLPPTIDGWIRLYLRLQIEGIKSGRTTECVRRDLDKFHVFFQAYTRDGSLTRWQPRVTQRFIEELQEQGLRAATITRQLASLRALAKWLLSVRPDFFPLGDPTAGTRPPVQDALKPKSLTDRQVKLLLDAAYHLVCKNYPAQEQSIHGNLADWRTRAFRTIRRPLRDYAILVLLLNAGIRREEVCNLNLDQLQGRKLVNIKCKGNIYRDLILGTETIQVIQSYLDRERLLDAEVFQSPALFLPSKSRQRGPGEGRLSVQAINRIINHVTNEANAQLSQTERFHVHPHMLRHTHAYKLLEKGRDLTFVQKRLGHLSLTYLSRYTQLPEDQEQDLMDSLEIL